MATVPEINDPELKKLIFLINPLLKPITVKVEPEEYAKENWCTDAVKEKIKRQGGSSVLGWQVWKSDFWIEAEFHAVWQSSDNEIIDITPKPIQVDKVIFLPDSQIKYVGAQIDNIRLNTTNNLIVDDVIEMFKAEFRLVNSGDRALEYKVELTDDETDLFKLIKLFQVFLYEMVKNGQDRESNCFCESTNKYKDCCYQKVLEISKSNI